MPPPARTPRQPVRRSSGSSFAGIFLKIALVATLAYAGFLAWQKIKADRRIAAAEAAAQAAEAPPAPRSLREDIPDVVPNPVDKTPPPPKDIEEPAAPKSDGRRMIVAAEDSYEDTLNAMTASANDSRDPVSFTDNPDAAPVLVALKSSGYRFTPAVRTAYLAYLERHTTGALAKMNKRLPSDFFGRIRSDAVVAATVFGARAQPEKVALMLYSLEQDLGRDAVFGKYKQLALATAVVCASSGWDANITRRDPMKLVIPGDPRKPVDTHDKTRTLDTDDHIVNFFKDHPKIKGVLVGGMSEGLADLDYDKSGTAKYNRKKSSGPLILRNLIPADVFADAKLQAEFNDYMKAHGETFTIDCGNHIIYPDLHEMITDGKWAPKIMAAYVRVREAFIKKGLLAERDAAATPAERCAYLIRNADKLKRLMAKYGRKAFPLDAPWPVMTLLAASGQPLREREDLLNRYAKNGELHTYGEYIGPIAQQYDFQNARRLAPFGFGYGSVQMMLKDGGVCGTMANIAVRSYDMLGIPAVTAGQPGHCALIVYQQNPKTRGYVCHGEQYVTGGDEATFPHGKWPFGDTDEGRPMVYYLSTAWGVNAGFSALLDDMLAYNLYRSLPDEDRAARGGVLLESVLTANPFYFPAVEALQNNATTAEAKLKVLKSLEDAVRSKTSRAGSPVDLFLLQIRKNLLRDVSDAPDKAKYSSEIEAVRKKVPEPKPKKA